MDTSMSFDSSLLYVHISTGEYQCCETVPRIGEAIRGSLTLFPSRWGSR